jgi:mevalonate kinase
MSNIMNDKIFYSKLLLFGEYSIIKNSMGLVIPYNMFHGKLSFDNKFYDRHSNKEISSFLSYLKKIDKENSLDMNLAEFDFDLKQGMYFDSNIPAGYGVGSSGALTAAVFLKYYKNKINYNDCSKLKEILGTLEAHFHGSSSGFDPLLSLVNTPLIFNEDKSISKVNLILDQSGPGAIFILDTGKSRRTEPLVNLFFEKLKNPEFEAFCLNDLTSVTNECIHNLLDQNFIDLVANFQQLSAFQLEHFRPMIPPTFHDVWVNGIETGKYSLKLCGAGGGGYLLGITSNFEQFKYSNPDKEIKVVFTF